MLDRLSSLKARNSSGTSDSFRTVSGLLTRELKQLLRDDEFVSDLRRFLEKPKPSFMSRIASSDLTKLIIGFLLTGVIGGLLTNYFTSRQKEVDRARAFQDKRSEILVAKIDEVFEQISLYEVAASRAYDNLAMDNAALVQNVIDGGFQSEDDLHKSDSPPARAIKNHLLERRRKSDEARALIVKARELAAKNRLWLGEQRYAMIQQFVSNAVELPQLEGTIRESPDISSRRAQLRRDFVRLSASAWDERAEDEPARCIDRK